MAIANDSYYNVYSEDYWVTSKTQSFTNTAGTFLTICLSTWSCAANMTHDSLTYNGVAMTKDKDQGRDAGGGCYERASIWSLQSPATGANNMVATFTGNTSGVTFQARSLTGVKTSSAFDVADGAVISCTSISRASTIADTGSISIEYNANAGNMTPTAGQTEQDAGAYLIGLSSGSKTFTWSLDSGCTGHIWALAVYKPAAAATATFVPRLTLMGCG